MELEQEKLTVIATKIQKLLALSKSPNEHEAASATAKAQELLELYNLDMLVIEQMSKKSGVREDTKMQGGLYKWQRELWKHVAELNFCMYWSIRGMKKGEKYEHRILGRATNVLSTRLMSEYLEQTIERITREQYANDPRYYFSKAGIAFREGMATRIGERLEYRRREQRFKAEDERRRQQTDVNARRALTILDVEEAENDANQEALHGWEPGTCAKMRADFERRRKEQWAHWEKLMEQQRQEEEAFRRDHPEEWARRKRDRKKRESKRKSSRSYTFKTWKPRHESYYDGYDRGDSVSLDRQINQHKPKVISNGD